MNPRPPTRGPDPDAPEFPLSPPPPPEPHPAEVPEWREPGDEPGHEPAPPAPRPPEIERPPRR